MPKKFTQCELVIMAMINQTTGVAKGGRVRTIKPNAGSYMHVCWSGGKSYSGEVKHNKAPKTLKRIGRK